MFFMNCIVALVSFDSKLKFLIVIKPKCLLGLRYNWGDKSFVIRFQNVVIEMGGSYWFLKRKFAGDKCNYSHIKFSAIFYYV